MPIGIWQKQNFSMEKPTFKQDPIDSSLPGSSVHGIFQARVLEQVAIAFSKVRVYGITKESDMN